MTNGHKGFECKRASNRRRGLVKKGIASWIQYPRYTLEEAIKLAGLPTNSVK